MKRSSEQATGLCLRVLGIYRALGWVRVGWLEEGRSSGGRGHPPASGTWALGESRCVARQGSTAAGPQAVAQAAGEGAGVAAAGLDGQKK